MKKFKYMMVVSVAVVLSSASAFAEDCTKVNANDAKNLPAVAAPAAPAPGPAVANPAAAPTDPAAKTQ